MKNIICYSCYESSKAGKCCTCLVSFIISLSWTEWFRSCFVTWCNRLSEITHQIALREARPIMAPFFPRWYVFKVPTKIWWGEGVESIDGGSFGELKPHSQNLSKVFEKYLWRSLFVKFAEYQPVSLELY